MMGFKDWFEEEKKYYPLRLDAISCRKGYEAGAASRQFEVENSYKIGYQDGFNSRQAEVDCLKAELDAANERALMLLDHKNKMVDKLQEEISQTKQILHNCLDIEVRKHHELQKRIDEALVEIAEYYYSDGMSDLVFSDMAKILKGESK